MLRRLRHLALFALLLAPSSVPAEVKVSMACRIKNRPPGLCGWCAIETLGRHHKLTTLYGLTDHHSACCQVSDLEDALDQAGVPYRIQYAGDTNLAILKHAIREDLGAVIGFRELRPGAGGHIVTLIDLTDDTAKVIDSNDVDRRTRVMSLDHFLYWWDGFALVLEPRLPAQQVITSRSQQAVQTQEPALLGATRLPGPPPATQPRK
jgi:hypothetical protein